MLAATDGSNAHRGAIWSLGLLVTAAAQLRSERNAARIAAAAAALARLPDRFSQPRPQSNGERARLQIRRGRCSRRGAGGLSRMRSASACRPSAQRVTEACLKTVARLDALMAIMASLDDTCLLHRGGPAALRAAKRGALAVLRAGGTAVAGRHRASASAALPSL